MSDIDSQKSYALSLLEMSSYDHEMRHQIEQFILNETNWEVLNRAITKLKDNQLDRITSGLNYNSTHIKEHINKLKNTWNQ
jgi:replicative DNA helicase